MKNVIAVVLTLISSVCLSQKNDFDIIKNEKTIGINLIDNSEISGIEYQFPDNIYQLFIDTTTNYLTIQQRGLNKNGKRLNSKGQYIQYDLNNHKTMWTRKANYLSSRLIQHPQSMICFTGLKSTNIDINTGKNLWSKKNKIYACNSDNHIALGYKYNYYEGFTNYLEGIDLRNGNTLWERSISKEYGWNEYSFINDSTILIVSSGLHAINLRTGRGWNYYTTTGTEDYTTNIAMNTAGLALGVATGNYIFTSGHNTVWSLVSNTLIDSSCIYIASEDRLAMLNVANGSILWQYPFPDKLASKSSIFIDDSTIYMINYGYAYTDLISK